MVRSFLDFEGLWDSSSLQNKMVWLSNSKIDESRLAAYSMLHWGKLPVDVQDALRVIK